MGALEYLKYGVIGLCAILTYFSYALLLREMRAPRPRRLVLRTIHIFMALSLLSMLIGLVSQIPFFNRSPNLAAARSSSLDDDYFHAQWEVSGHDIDFGNFKARYEYNGIFTGSVQANELILEGDLVTIDAKTKIERGTAHFTARGPINNNQVAAYYTYKNTAVNGFGTSFIEFDSSGHGQMYVVFRITRTIPGEGDIGAGQLTIVRRSPKAEVNLPAANVSGKFHATFG